MKQYVSDLGAEGMLFAAVVRSPVSNGYITGVALAKEDKDECILIDAKSVVGHSGLRVNGVDIPIFCTGKVSYKGESVAVVLANSGERAREAANRALISVECALNHSKPHSAAGIFAAAKDEHDSKVAAAKRAATGVFESASDKKIGDIFGKADKVVTSRRMLSTSSYGLHEVCGAVCVYSLQDDGRPLFTVLCPTSSTPRLRSALCRVLNESGDNITVQVTTRHYEAVDYQTDIAALQAALASSLTKRSVRLLLTREEDTKYNQNKLLFNIKHTAAMKDSSLYALKVEIEADIGAYNPFAAEVLERAAKTFMERLPNVLVYARAVYSNRPPTAFDEGEVDSVMMQDMFCGEHYLNISSAHLPEVAKTAIKMSDFSRKYVAYRMTNPLEGVRRGVGAGYNDEGAAVVELEMDTVLGNTVIEHIWIAAAKGDIELEAQEAMLVAVEKDAVCATGKPLPNGDDGGGIVKIAFCNAASEADKTPAYYAALVHSLVPAAIGVALSYVGN